MQAIERAEMPFLSLLTLTLELWPWPSTLCERGTKHVFRVNLAQIRSARSTPKTLFLAVVTLTFYLWSWPSSSSEWGSNTPSLWICRKSVQRFVRYFIHKQKKSQTAPKTEAYAVHW